MTTRPTEQELGEAFIKISFEEDGKANSADKLYEPWIESGSAQRSDPLIYGVNALRKLYPKHVVTVAQTNLLSFPGVLVEPIAPENTISTTFFVPFARRLGAAGALVENVSFGGFRLAWDKYDFLVYIVKFVQGFGTYTAQFVLHEGSEEPARHLLLAAGAWQVALHNEIWVFNQGWWDKDARLYAEIQKADWRDVILDETFKAALQKDVYGFFSSEQIYKELGIPWKRGLIMYGPPGNGKTISIKAIMKSCTEKGHAVLYVKSFTSFMGDEASMELIFEKARSEAPCVMILEDLDSLITERNRSFFLNQLDGLSDNDGMLIIGTTNHFEKLDPALSTRPSRFDRKYLFENPTRDERILYIEYWQNKLAHNKDVSFPDELKQKIADTTHSFSFAYLKEAFISSLVLMAGFDGDKKPEFSTVIKEQIQHLRSQLDHEAGSVASETPSFARSGMGGGVGPREKQFIPSVEGCQTSDGSKIYRTEPPSTKESKDLNSVARAAVALGRSFIY